MLLLELRKEMEVDLVPRFQSLFFFFLPFSPPFCLSSACSQAGTSRYYKDVLRIALLEHLRGTAIVPDLRLRALRHNPAFSQRASYGAGISAGKLCSACRVWYRLLTSLARFSVAIGVRLVLGFCVSG